MAMAHVRHVVVRVQITAALFVEEILRPAANELDRLTVRDAQIPAERPPPSRKRFGLARRARRKQIYGYAENQVRIGRQTPPDVTLAGAADSGKIAIGVEQISDDLKMQVRRPSAVFSW